MTFSKRRFPYVPNISFRIVLRLSLSICTVAALVATLSSGSCAAYSADQVANTYIYLVAGQDGSVDDASPTRNASVDVNGRWGIGTTGGDPTTVKDNNIALIAGSPDPWGAYTIIKVDETAAIVYGDKDKGSWVSVPSGDQDTDTITDSYLLKDVPVVVSRKMSILRDVVRIEYQIENTDVNTHKIGLATSLDTEYGSDTNAVPITGGPFYSLLTGAIDKEQKFLGTDIPDVIYGFDNLPAYNVVTQTILKGGEITTPDKVITTNAAHSFGDFWAFEPVSSHSILSDSGLLLYWDQKSIPAGRKRDPIVFYFGLGPATEDFNFPAVLALQGPFSLTYDRAAGSTTGTIGPDPVTVYGYVYNLNPEIGLKDVQVNLSLGYGLEFAPNEIATKTIGSIAPSGEGFVTWNIRADGTESGPLGYTISVVGSPLTAKAVTRTINVPATEQRYFYGNEWQMMSVPFAPDNPAPDATLGMDLQIPVLNPFPVFPLRVFKAVRLSPSLGAYLDINAIIPGQAYWFKPVSDLDVVAQSVSPIPSTITEPSLIPLSTGWNQIGNPFLYGVFWGRIRVLKDPAQGSVSLSEAIASNWIRGTIYRWDPTLGVAGDYVISSAASTVLYPWEGYWLKALQPVSLVIAPPDAVGGNVTVSLAASSSSALPMATFSGIKSGISPQQVSASNDWLVKLSAVGETGSDACNYFGQSVSAKDGYDRMDVEKAPPCGSISLAFLNNDWGKDSGRYASDIRGAGLRKTISFEVTATDRNQKITLNWANLESVPRGMRLQLVDKTGKNSITMSAGRSYSFQAQAGKPRLFQIISTARGRLGR